MSKEVVVVSGGLDSTTLLYLARHCPGDNEIYAISFNYGQRHLKELDYARKSCGVLGVNHEVVDLTNITKLLGAGGSSLVSDAEVPDGHYAAENMKQTVVPNRNMIMASIAAGYAVAMDADRLWLGVHAGDHFIYPDCRPAFFNHLNIAVVLGNEGFGKIPEIKNNDRLPSFVLTPFIHSTKNDIASEAVSLGVPLEDTWSCYKGGINHCGRCGTCVERQEAIASTGVVDPTVYDDPNYWLKVVKEN